MTTEPTSPWGRGDWMQTYTGRQFFPLDPDITSIDIRDIAHALSQICRYGGHTRLPYSVAEHAVLVSQSVPDDDALPGLMHDAAEAYLGDIVRPIKRHWPEYRYLEDRLLAMIGRRFEVDGLPQLPASVVDVDNRILLDERAYLLTAPPASWHQEGLEPLGVTIGPMASEQAEQAFLTRFQDLVHDRYEHLVDEQQAQR